MQNNNLKTKVVSVKLSESELETVQKVIQVKYKNRVKLSAFMRNVILDVCEDELESLQN